MTRFDSLNTRTIVCHMGITTPNERNQMTKDHFTDSSQIDPYDFVFNFEYKDQWIKAHCVEGVMDTLTFTDGTMLDGEDVESYFGDDFDDFYDAKEKESDLLHKFKFELECREADDERETKEYNRREWEARV